jgi:hypothetical protein
MDGGLSVARFSAYFAISLGLDPSTNSTTDDGAVVGNENPAWHFELAEGVTGNADERFKSLLV